MRYHLFSLMLIVLLALACKDTPKTTADRLAAAVCECTGSSQIAELNREAEIAFTDTTRTEEAVRLIEQIAKEHDNISGCMKQVMTEFGSLKPEETDQYMAALKKSCPRLDSALVIYSLELVKGE